MRNTSRRYTASQSYNHPWVQQQVEAESKNLEIDPDVIKKIGDFIESQM